MKIGEAIAICAVGDCIVISRVNRGAEFDVWYRYFWKEEIMRSAAAIIPHAVCEIREVRSV